MKKSLLITFIVLAVLVADQALKIWVKTHMEYGEEFSLLGLDWALIHFVENNGMAFGMTLGGAYGKLALSVFRIIAVAFLIYYLRTLIRGGVSSGVLIGFALILAGAMGNILDSAFYGIIFSESPYHGGLAELFPEGGGYSSFLHGKVVDMFYFPLVNTYLPDWVPIWGGEHIMFFKPVFNIADAAISTGVIYILLFQRSFFHQEDQQVEVAPTAAAGREEDIGREENRPGQGVPANPEP
ncbi:lipoprotein signal peptidase [Phaeodactylibacter luteus]|uniref:Lipoprotein signal peptidase n=1 Tax=Phaeodactylibacter luteus TaxID=1564516 RepID=A0A5C6RLN3_9BACT|nr:lipoprotein signal peptidase [Phaeodactylibacter luteus]TXB63301.1 lipoprotein signal peptidase [Phaeodactylibacter luteus]